jgi:hypothetical protein
MHKCGLSIEHNECRNCYQTVKQYLDDMESRWGGPTWASEEDKARAIETNEMWEIQWYPETPIGFHRVASATLEGAVELANSL